MGRRHMRVPLSRGARRPARGLGAARRAGPERAPARRNGPNAAPAETASRSLRARAARAAAAPDAALGRRRPQGRAPLRLALQPDPGQLVADRPRRPVDPRGRRAAEPGAGHGRDARHEHCRLGRDQRPLRLWLRLHDDHRRRRRAGDADRRRQPKPLKQCRADRKLPKPEDAGEDAHGIVRLADRQQARAGRREAAVRAKLRAP